MTVITGSKFKRSFKRLVKKKPQLQDKIFATLEILSNDPFTASLKSHKLTGQLEGLWACSVAYDCPAILIMEILSQLIENRLNSDSCKAPFLRSRLGIFDHRRQDAGQNENC